MVQFKVLSLNLPGSTQKNYEKPQSGPDLRYLVLTFMETLWNTVYKGSKINNQY
jgi:hypothetical protein